MVEVKMRDGLYVDDLMPLGDIAYAGMIKAIKIIGTQWLR